MRSGDTCDAIAVAKGISTELLLALNPTVNPECTDLQIGQVLCLGR